MKSKVIRRSFLTRAAAAGTAAMLPSPARVIASEHDSVYLRNITAS